MKTYFGFAIADSMFSGDVVISRKSLGINKVKKIIAKGVIPCINPNHQATIVAMQKKFGINVPIPAIPPKVKINNGDSIIVMSVRGLPRLTDRREYKSSEIGQAEFEFSLYEVIE